MIPIDASRIRIVLVEDEAAHLDGIFRAFKNSSLLSTDIRVAGTLAEYRQVVGASPPSIALIDLNLPDGNAFDLLVSPPETGPFPILIMTSHGSEKLAVEAMKAGALDYVVKTPEVFHNLPHIVSRALREWKLLKERRQSELELAAREAQYRRLVEGVPAILYSFSTSRGFLFFSSRAESVLGYPRTRLYVERSLWLDSIHPDDRLKVDTAMTESVSVKGYNLEYRIRDATGNYHWLADRSIGTWIEHGETIIEGLAFDITEKKRLVDEALLQQRQLQQADKMISLGILVSGIAHEINNPNHFILSNLAPLERSWADALPILDRYYAEHGDFRIGGQHYSDLRRELPEIFANLRGGSERIKSIVDELRDYAREWPVDLSSILSLNQVVKSALVLMANMLRRSTTRLRLEYGENIPKIRGDYQRLEQVAVNLLQNACQALPGPESGIEINTGFDLVRKVVTLTVRDEGTGIAADDLPRIQVPFYTTKRASGGTGLGLSISAGIANDHGGWLEFESAPGQGTIARLVLPAITQVDSL